MFHAYNFLRMSFINHKELDTIESFEGVYPGPRLGSSICQKCLFSHSLSIVSESVIFFPWLQLLVFISHQQLDPLKCLKNYLYFLVLHLLYYKINGQPKPVGFSLLMEYVKLISRRLFLHKCSVFVKGSFLLWILW